MPPSGITHLGGSVIFRRRAISAISCIWSSGVLRMKLEAWSRNSRLGHLSPKMHPFLQASAQLICVASTAVPSQRSIYLKWYRTGEVGVGDRKAGVGIRWRRSPLCLNIQPLSACCRSDRAALRPLGRSPRETGCHRWGLPHRLGQSGCSRPG